MNPIIEKINGIYVVRDDLYPGGTKARAFEELYKYHDEIVYACSAQSITQISLSLVAKRLGKKATCFVAKRTDKSKETNGAIDLGANVVEISPGYLSVVKARAKIYCDQTSAWLAPLGFDDPVTLNSIGNAARSIDIIPDEVWCAAGSGTLSRGLQNGWPNANHTVVMVGKDADIGQAEAFHYPLPFEKKSPVTPPFPCNAYYDSKAWEICVKAVHPPDSIVLFWNVSA